MYTLVLECLSLNNFLICLFMYYFYFRCDSVKKLQNKLDILRLHFNDPLIFKSIYRYAYDFARVS